MECDKKSALIIDAIGLLCAYIVFGAIYHFVSGYDLLSTIRLLAIQTFLLLIGAVFVVAVVWLLFFVSSKIKRRPMK